MRIFLANQVYWAYTRIHGTRHASGEASASHRASRRIVFYCSRPSSVGGAVPLMKFLKPTLSVEDQITLPERRGMIVPDRKRAARSLRYISYDRLSAD